MSRPRPQSTGFAKDGSGAKGHLLGLSLTFECELGYTFDPAAWGQGFATEAARCVRDYARDVLRLSYAVSAILPHNTRSRAWLKGWVRNLPGKWT